MCYNVYRKILLIWYWSYFQIFTNLTCLLLIWSGSWAEGSSSDTGARLQPNIIFVIMIVIVKVHVYTEPVSNQELIWLFYWLSSLVWELPLCLIFSLINTTAFIVALKQYPIYNPIHFLRQLIFLTQVKSTLSSWVNPYIEFDNSSQLVNYSSTEEYQRD